MAYCCFTKKNNVKRLNSNVERIEKFLKDRDSDTRAVIVRTVSKGGWRRSRLCNYIRRTWISGELTFQLTIDIT